MSLSSGSPGLILFLMPSSMAISMAAKARYGLHEPSGQRNSMRLAFGLRRVDRDADRRRAVAAAVGEVDRRLVAGHQPLVAVGRRVGDGAQGRGVLEQAADGVHGPCRTARRSREPANRLSPSFHSEVWTCMPVPLSMNSGLGMNVAVLPCFLATFLTMYLYFEHVVGHLDQRGEAHVDLALAAGGDFVVLGLDLQAALDHGQHHLGADVVQRVGRRHREIAFLVAELVAEVRASRRGRCSRRLRRCRGSSSRSAAF